MFKNEIFDSSFKMLMLLQMIDKESALDLQRELQKQRLEIETDFLQSVHNYNESFNFLIRKTNHKEDFYKTFTLYSCKEQQVLTEKDRNAR